jgi:hypothetical protein
VSCLLQRFGVHDLRDLADLHIRAMPNLTRGGVFVLEVG